MVGRNFAVEPGGVHGIDERIENHHIEVPQQNGEGRQEGFVPVHGSGGVGDPLRKMTEGKIVEPEQKTGNGTGPNWASRVPF
jgi:hypothetical protein